MTSVYKHGAGHMHSVSLPHDSLEPSQSAHTASPTAEQITHRFFLKALATTLSFVGHSSLCLKEVSLCISFAFCDSTNMEREEDDPPEAVSQSKQALSNLA